MKNLICSGIFSYPNIKSGDICVGKGQLILSED